MESDKFIDQQPLLGIVGNFQPIEIIIVDRSELESVWDAMVRQYHYLGLDKMIGPRIKYMALYQGKPIAALSYNRASLSVGIREQHIGWNPEQKRELLRHVVNNNRFLILPWVKVKNLASHLLSRTLKLLKEDWRRLYGVAPYVVETFVDREKFKGTCYLAANWTYAGETKGYGKVGKAFVYHGKRKGVYLYVLNKKFVAEMQGSNRIDPFHQPLRKVGRAEPNMMLQTMDWHPQLLEDAGVTVESVGQLGARLNDFLSAYDTCYDRSEQRGHADAYVKGLLSDLERKSIEPIALRYASPTGVRALQHFAQAGVWDDKRMQGIYQRRISSFLADPDGMMNVDGSDFPKKGAESVGVARQYCGTLGKTDNCQAGVFIGYASAKGYGLIDKRLYMPTKWFDSEHKERRDKCGVPGELAFKTKPQLALEMLGEAVASGLFPAKWIGMDSAFGCNKEFLDAIPEELYYFADVPSNTLVFAEMPEVKVPEYTGKGRRDLKPKASAEPLSVSSLAASEERKWSRVCLGEGAKGPIMADELALRIVDCRSGLPSQELWLYIRRLADGSLKFSLCNAPLETALETLRSLAIRRWPIEQCFEECKSYLGMDHCEGRSWKSWHRHMLFVFIAHLFLLELRLLLKKTAK